MTIASQTSRISYVGDGSTTAFAVPFYFQANADIKVYLQNASGASTLQTLGTDYTLTGAGVSTGGTCTFTSAPTATTGAVISIYRDPPVTQTTSYNNNDPFPAKSHENALDKLTMLEQRTRDIASRSFLIPDSDPVLDTHLPAANARKSKLLGFDNNGVPTAVLGPSFVGGTDIGSAVVSTKAVAAVTTFAGSVIYLLTGGTSIVGDGGSATYKRGTGTGSFTDGGGVSWVPFISGTSVTGPSGSISFTNPPQGRLTVTTGVPVPTSSVTSATTVYYTPYGGQQIPIYDGTNFATFSVAEISQTTTDTTKSPAACANNSNYDLFVWYDSGTIRLSRGPVWTNSTTRSAGTALTLVNGIYLNTVSITNGPAASRGTYVGTIRTNGTATVNYILGGFAAGSTAADLGVWNAYNRVPVYAQIGDSTSSWTHNVANTWRAANGSATARVSAVRGFDVDQILATYFAVGAPGAATSIANGVGVNSTTGFSGTNGFETGGTAHPQLTARYSGLMGLGYVFIAPLEYNTTTTASTWYGGVTVYSQANSFNVELLQ